MLSTLLAVVAREVLLSFIHVGKLQQRSPLDRFNSLSNHLEGAKDSCRAALRFFRVRVPPPLCHPLLLIFRQWTKSINLHGMTARPWEAIGSRGDSIANGSDPYQRQPGLPLNLIRLRPDNKRGNLLLIHYTFFDILPSLKESARYCLHPPSVTMPWPQNLRFLFGVSALSDTPLRKPPHQLLGDQGQHVANRAQRVEKE